MDLAMFYVRIAVLLIVAVLPASCATDADKTGEYTGLLVGTWREIRRPGSDIYEQTIQLFPEHLLIIKGKKIANGRLTNFTYKGQWEVRNDIIRYKITSSDPPELCSACGEQRYKILSVNETDWLMVEESTGSTSRAQRVE
jgi:hypothetical protein